jgi:hypothetical protein
MSNWNSVKEVTNWKVEQWNSGTVRNELLWNTLSKRKLRATALQDVTCYFIIGFFSERLFFGTVPTLFFSERLFFGTVPTLQLFQNNCCVI